jgi:4-amino-4-deoxy-L-arabinose transferase-like glycosyltransferase
LIVLGIFLYHDVNKLIPAAALFPKIMLVTFIFFISLTLINGIRESIKSTKEQDFESGRLLRWVENKMPYCVYAIILSYVVLLKMAGFFLATGLFIPTLMLFYKNRSKLKIFSVTVGTLLFVYVVFVCILKATLP